MRRNLYLFIFFSLFSLSAISQELKDDLTRLQSGEDLKVLYRNESSFSLFVHSAGGLGIAYRRGYHIHGTRKRMLEIEAQNFKHPKEIKSVNSYYDNAKGFVYGKLNSFLVIRPGIGFQNILFEKAEKKNVEIRFSYFVGATIAFAKPVYLEVIRPTHDPSINTVSTERYDPNEHFPAQIYGKASFFKGVDQMRVYPGGYGKVALSFEYGKRYNVIKALETGAVLDVYPVALPMMAFSKKQQVFATLYLKMVWGKKWF
ncbi:MAG TPA: hypothetical protein VGC65_06640 [Bacteroidia bacterium]|jgi:hypothetical protein